MDLSFIDSEGIQLSERRQLQLDPSLNPTTADGVFAAGDVATGPGLMIHTIASGKETARRIYAYLNNTEIQSKTTATHAPLRMYSRESGYESIPREGVPAMSPEERKRSMTSIVEKGFTEAQSIRQGSRCFNCAVNTIFNGERCILCGGCADVCPEACLKLVSLDRIEGNADFAQLVYTAHGQKLHF